MVSISSAHRGVFGGEGGLFKGGIESISSVFVPPVALDPSGHAERRLLLFSATIPQPVIDVVHEFIRGELFVKIGRVRVPPFASACCCGLRPECCSG